MKLTCLAPALLLTAAATPAPQADNTPHGTLMASVEALRSNDLLGYAKLTLTAEAVSEAGKQWDEYRAQPTDAEQDQKFAEVMAVLNGPQAADLIMGLIEPHIEEARPQLQQMSAFASMMGQMAISQSEQLSDKEKEEGAQIVAAVAEWLSQNDLADLDHARQAVEVLCSTVRSLEIHTMDDLRALPFDKAMGKVGHLFGALKAVLKIYGLDMNAWLDSASAETIDRKNGVATVRFGFTLFGIDSEVETEMMEVDGRWLPRSSQELDMAQLGSAGF